MKLHRMVNGKKVDLSEEEEAQMRAEWTQNRKEHEEERKRRKANKEKQRLLKEKFAKMMDVSVEDIELMMGKKDELLGD